MSDKNFKGKIENYPAIFNHFEPNKEKLKEAKIKYKTPNKKYFYLHRERDERFFKKGDKIISSTRTLKPAFTFTEDEFYGSRALNFIKTDRINLRYLTGIFNSKLSHIWLKYMGKMTGELLQIYKSQLMSIPIFNANDDQQNEVADLVTNIISTKQKQLDYKALLEKAKSENNFDREIQLTKELEQFSKNISQAESKINTIIFELYGLDSSEIATIEKNINL